MNKTLFVFLIGIGIVGAQTPTPSDQARQIELKKEAQGQAFTILGVPDALSVPTSSRPLAATNKAILKG